MIALLSGKIAFKSVDHVIVDVGGVGYRVTVPLSTFYALPDGGDVRLHIHTHVKEDAFNLYGFMTPEEKDLFILLISVSGVGPKLAANILSNIPASPLQMAIAEGDIKRLSAIPGIGKKTAERLALELREKITRLSTGGLPHQLPDTLPSAASATEEAISALVNLGYKENQAKKALQGITSGPDASLEEVLKAALKVLMK